MLHARSWLARVDPRAEWPHGAVRLGVVVCIALAVGVGLAYFVKAVEVLGDEAGRNAIQNFDDREFAGGNAIVVDKNALYEARALIPPDETYRVVVGPSVTRATELTEPHIGEFARYFLMPRRPAPDAPWVLCYGCDLSQFGSDLAVVWRNGAGIAIGKPAE